MTKKLILAAFSFCMLAQAQAQVGSGMGVSSPITIGASAGGTMLRGDLPSSQISPALKLNADYNFGAFLSVGVEGQYGIIEEGHKEATEIWASNLYAKSNYMGVNINGRVALGQFLKLSKSDAVNLARNFYVGAGFGYLKSHGTDIVRNNMAGNDNGSAFCVPTNAGIDIPLKKTAAGLPKIQLNLNYQFTFAMNDNFDAFNYSSNWNKKNDAFSMFSIGIKLALGHPKFNTL